MDINDLFNPSNPSPVDESLRDNDLKDNDLKLMKLIDETVSALKANKEEGIDESMMSDLRAQLRHRLDCLKLSDSPTARKWKERTIKAINDLRPSEISGI